MPSSTVPGLGYMYSISNLSKYGVSNVGYFCTTGILFCVDRGDEIFVLLIVSSTAGLASVRGTEPTLFILLLLLNVCVSKYLAKGNTAVKTYSRFFATMSFVQN